MTQVPVGVRLVQAVNRKVFPGLFSNKNLWFRISVLVLTFMSYTCYHASRKPLSVVKAYFNRSCSGIAPPPGTFINDSNRNSWCDWDPFDGPEASTLLGTLDSSFLFAYAAAMFFSGFVAERVSLRYFLAVGMIASGISCYLFGITHHFGIHAIWYYILVQIFGGIVQSTGWPGVVTVVGNWFGKGKRGLIFGIWNSHTSVGNIVGTLMASAFLETDWGLSFMVPGLVIAIAGFINFMFLVESPEDVGCEVPHRPNSPNMSKREADSPREILHDEPTESDLLLECRIQETPVTKGEEKAVGFIGAMKIPGVIEFSLCLFFAKLVSYTFLYWLPFYIKSSTTLSESQSANLSTIFDVGGILGGIFAGLISDYSGMNACTCAVMLIISIPLLLLYYLFGSVSNLLNISMLTLAGFFVNGPYALITTAVSAELGTHKSLSSNSKALATVTAIIDGTGSIGAAVGPLLAGLVYNLGWESVFYMLMLSDFIALLMLLRLVKKEIQCRRAGNQEITDC